jgi:hypothetical protein
VSARPALRSLCWLQHAVPLAALPAGSRWLAPATPSLPPLLTALPHPASPPEKSVAAWSSDIISLSWSFREQLEPLRRLRCAVEAEQQRRRRHGSAGEEQEEDDTEPSRCGGLPAYVQAHAAPAHRCCAAACVVLPGAASACEPCLPDALCSPASPCLALCRPDDLAHLADQAVLMLPLLWLNHDSRKWSARWRARSARCARCSSSATAARCCCWGACACCLALPRLALACCCCRCRCWAQPACCWQHRSPAAPASPAPSHLLACSYLPGRVCVLSPEDSLARCMLERLLPAAWQGAVAEAEGESCTCRAWMGALALHPACPPTLKTHATAGHPPLPCLQRSSGGRQRRRC